MRPLSIVKLHKLSPIRIPLFVQYADGARPGKVRTNVRPAALNIELPLAVRKEVDLSAKGLGVCNLVGKNGIEPLTTDIVFSVPLPLSYSPYCPRSVHTLFQGLSVVFGLLISIPSPRLTEPNGSHLFWLCECAESDLITSVGWGCPSTLHIYYITTCLVCQEVFQNFLEKFFDGLSYSSVRGVEPLASCGTRCHLASPLDTTIIP